MSWNCPTNWTETISSTSRLWSFRANATKVSGHPMHVLSSASREISGHLDNYAQELSRLQQARTERYMGAPATGDIQAVTGTRDLQPQDVLYIIMRDNCPIMALHANGEITTNEPAMTNKRYADTVKRLKPALEAIDPQRLTDW